MEIKNLQAGIKINTEYDSAEDIRNLILGIITEVNANGFAVDSAHIDGTEVFKSDKGFINSLEIKD